MAGYKSLLGFWAGGAGSVTPTSSGGVKSLLAPWLGGASAPIVVTNGGYRSMLAFWAGGAYGYESVTPPAVEQHGGHFGGDWYRHYKHPNESKKYRKPIAAEIREMYEAMVDVAPTIELVKIKAVIAEYVEKPSLDSANVQLIIPPPSIDWVALAKDIEQVYALARIYDRLVAEYEDEAAFLLLM